MEKPKRSNRPIEEAPEPRHPPRHGNGQNLLDDTNYTPQMRRAWKAFEDSCARSTRYLAELEKRIRDLLEDQREGHCCPIGFREATNEKLRKGS